MLGFHQQVLQLIHRKIADLPSLNCWSFLNCIVSFYQWKTFLNEGGDINAEMMSHPLKERIWLVYQKWNCRMWNVTGTTVLFLAYKSDVLRILTQRLSEFLPWSWNNLLFLSSHKDQATTWEISFHTSCSLAGDSSFIDMVSPWMMVGIPRTSLPPQEFCSSIICYLAVYEKVISWICIRQTRWQAYGDTDLCRFLYWILPKVFKPSL